MRFLHKNKSTSVSRCALVLQSAGVRLARGAIPLPKGYVFCLQKNFLVIMFRLYAEPGSNGYGLKCPASPQFLMRYTRLGQNGQ